MPTFIRNFTFPQVHISPFSSRLRAIDGVGTSVTAFVGRARCGPEDAPVRVRSFADYQRAFGGLWEHSSMSYAVLQYFQNGGGDALVVRVQNGGAAATLSLPGGLQLIACSRGAWGNALRVRVEHTEPSLADDTLFKLSILDTASGVAEQFDQLSIQRSSSRFVNAILQQQSKLVRTSGAMPTARPTAHALPPAGADPLRDDLGSTPFNADGSDGLEITDDQLSLPSLEAAKRGLWALQNATPFNLLCIPPLGLSPGRDINARTRNAAARYCQQRRAIYLVDPLASWTSAAHVVGSDGLDGTAWGMARIANVALYFPAVMQPDPLQGDRLTRFAPCGAVAGVIARTDGNRGVWKAPAGRDATLYGVPALAVSISSTENRQLNALGVNCLRALPMIGRVVWGARTMLGADRLGSQWKYLAVRRLALHIEASLEQGTQWCAFEVNDEPLWGQLRLAVEAFMASLFRDGAFQGDRSSEAYFVKCGRDTTAAGDIARGIVNIEVGFAALRPAEFIVIRVQQAAGLPRS